MRAESVIRGPNVIEKCEKIKIPTQSEWAEPRHDDVRLPPPPLGRRFVSSRRVPEIFSLFSRRKLIYTGFGRFYYYFSPHPRVAFAGGFRKIELALLPLPLPLPLLPSAGREKSTFYATSTHPALKSGAENEPIRGGRNVIVELQ